MVKYKNVTDLPIIDEATETTHVIVEDNGSFKRMSGDKLGGANGAPHCFAYRNDDDGISRLCHIDMATGEMGEFVTRDELIKATLSGGVYVSISSQDDIVNFDFIHVHRIYFHPQIAHASVTLRYDEETEAEIYTAEYVANTGGK